jgi:hypothetical protein
VLSRTPLRTSQPFGHFRALSGHSHDAASETRAFMWLARPSSLRTMARREREVVEHSSPAVPEQAADADDLVEM